MDNSIRQEVIDTVALALAVLYNVWSISVRLAFIDVEDPFEDESHVFFALDLLSDVVIYINLARRFISCYGVAFKNEKVLPLSTACQSSIRSESFQDISFTELVQDLSAKRGETSQGKKTVFKLGMRAAKILAILSMAPIDYFWSSPSHQLMEARSFRLVHAAFFICLVHAKMMKLLKKGKVITDPAVDRACTLFAVMFIVAHMAACIFFNDAVNSALRGESRNWAMNDPVLFHLSGQHQVVLDKGWTYAYLRSLYWAMITLITTGYGDVVAVNETETVVATVVMMTGFILCTLSIANLINLFLTFNQSAMEYQAKKESLNAYMNHRKLSKQLRHRIISIFEFDWVRFNGMSEGDVLEELPTTLRQKVSNEVVRSLLKRMIVSLLKHEDCNDFLNSLVLSVQSEVFAPGDVIVATSAIQSKVFLVSQGVAAQMTVYESGAKTAVRLIENDREQSEDASYSCGHCIGLGALLLKGSTKMDKLSRSQYQVEAKTYVEVFIIDSTEFSKCCDLHLSPMQSDKIRQNIVRMLSSENKLLSSYMGCLDDARNTVKGWKRILLPRSNFRKVWCTMLVTGWMYYCLITPLWLASAYPPKQSGGFTSNKHLLLLSYHVDLVFIIDMILRYRYFYFEVKGSTVLDPSRITAKFNADCCLFWEILMSVPWDVSVLVIGVEYCGMLRWFRLLRLFAYPQLINNMKYHVNFTSVLEMVGSTATFRRFIKLNIMLMLLCHWVGCLFILAGRTSQHLGSSSWIESDERDERFYIDNYGTKLTFSLYLRGIYWAMVGMSTVGYGDILPRSSFEMWYATIVVLFGGIIVPGIVGGLAACVVELNQAWQAHRSKATRAEELLVRRKHPPEHINLVRKYFQYLWTKQRGINETNMLSKLPVALKDQVMVHIASDVFQRVSMFKLFGDEMRNEILKRLIPVVFCPNSTVLYAGDVGTKLVLIEVGTMQEFLPINHNVVVAMLSKGQCCGECCLLESPGVYATSVVSITYCDCFELSRCDFLKVIQEIEDSLLEKFRLKLFSHLKRKVQAQHHILKNMQGRSKRVLQKTFPFIIINQIEPMDHRSSLTTITVGGISALNQCINWMKESKFELLNAIMLLLKVFTVFSVPFRVAFYTPIDSFVGEYVVDLLFIAKSWFDHKTVNNTSGSLRCFDWIACIPFELVLVVLDAKLVSSKVMLNVILSVVRIPKLARLHNIQPCLHGFMDWSKEHSTWYSDMVLEGFKLLVIVLLFGHCIACGYFSIARYSNIVHSHMNDGCEATESMCSMFKHSWVALQIEEEKLPSLIPLGKGAFDCYVRAFNWALPTLLVVVIGDVIPTTIVETLYAFVSIFIGMTLNGAIIGVIAGIFANLEPASALHARNLDSINAYCSAHHFSPGLQQRVLDFLGNIWSHHRGCSVQEEIELLSELPMTIREVLATTTKLPLLNKCRFLEFCSADILRSLATCMEPRRFAKNDVVMWEGEMGAEMFFISTGSVEVLSKDLATTYATLYSGSFFGEQALFYKSLRSATVRACEYCEVFVIEKHHFDTELISRDFDISTMIERFEELKRLNESTNWNLVKNLNTLKKKKQNAFKQTSTSICDDNIVLETPALPPEWFEYGSVFIACWNGVALFLVCYNVVSIPFFASFHLDVSLSHSSLWMNVIMDILIDVFYYVDFALTLTCFTQQKSRDYQTIVDDEQRHEENSRKSWLKKYCTSDMLLYVLCLFPVELFTLQFGVDSYYMLKLLHMIRFLWIPSYVRQISVFLSLKQFHISASITLVVQLFIVFAFIDHVIACFWFALHRIQAGKAVETWASTSSSPIAYYDSRSHKMVLGEVDHSGVTIAYCYSRSLYMTTATLSSVGYGDIYPTNNLETIFQNVVIVVACLLGACVIGGWQALLTHYDESGVSAMEGKVARIEMYLKYRCLNMTVQKEVIDHYANEWYSNKVVDYKNMLQLLSSPLQLDVAGTVFAHPLKSKLFQDCSEMTKKRFAAEMRKQFVSAGCVIYDADDIGVDVYGVESGSVVTTVKSGIMNQDSRLVDTIPTNSVYSHVCASGDHFGETCVLNSHCIRLEKAVAYEDTQLVTIAPNRFLHVLSFLPMKQRVALCKRLLKTKDITNDTENSIISRIQDITGGTKESKDMLLKSKHRVSQVSPSHLMLNKPLIISKANPKAVLKVSSFDGDETSPPQLPRLSFSADAMARASRFVADWSKFIRAQETNDPKGPSTDSRFKATVDMYTTNRKVQPIS